MSLGFQLKPMLLNIRPRIPSQFAYLFVFWQFPTDCTLEKVFEYGWARCVEKSTLHASNHLVREILTGVVFTFTISRNAETRHRTATREKAQLLPQQTIFCQNLVFFSTRHTSIYQGSNSDRAKFQEGPGSGFHFCARQGL